VGREWTRIDANEPRVGVVYVLVSHQRLAAA